MLILGVDPGVSGALALIDTRTGGLDVWDVPSGRVMTSTKKSRLDIDVAALADIVAIASPDVAYIEQVSAMPGQGVTSMFRFGDAFGVLRGVLSGARVPVHYIRPQEWQRIARVPRGPDGGRIRANQLFPKNTRLFSRVKDHNRADAALIAYAATCLEKENPAPRLTAPDEPDMF